MSSEHSRSASRRRSASAERGRSRDGSSRHRGGRSRKRELERPIAVSAEALTSIQTPLGSAEYIVFDLETTGGNPEKNGITEIFAIRYREGKIIDTFGTLVNPGIPIPPIVRRMTGINNQMVRGAPRIHEVMPKFLEFIGRGVLVSHNTIGDMKFVRHFATRACDVTVDNFFLCTHLLVERLAPEAPDKSLKGLAEYFNLARGELHRAEADAYVTLELFKVLYAKLEQCAVRRVEDAVRLQGDLDSGMRLGWGVSEDALAKVPTGPGLFFLYDHDQRPLFLSSAGHLSREVTKLRSFEQLPRPLLRLALRSSDLKATSSPNLYAAMLAECDEITKHRLSFAPVGWHQRVVQTLFIAEDDEGLRLGVGPMEPGTKYAFGPVRDRRLVSEFLEGVAEIFGGRASRRGVIVPVDKEEIFLELLQGTLARRLKDLDRRRRSLTLWFRPAERRALNAQAEELRRLLDLTLPSRLAPLIDRSGILGVPARDGRSWQLYVIVGSRPIKHALIRGDFDETVHEHAARLAGILELERGRLTSGEPLAADAVCRINATLWWLGNARGEFKFVTIEELQGMGGAPTTPVTNSHLDFLS